jgi:hypothetical protein
MNCLLRTLAILALNLQTISAVHNTLIVPRTPDNRMCTLHLKSFSNSRKTQIVINSILHSNQGTVLWTIWTRNSSIIVQPTSNFNEPYSINILLQHVEEKEPQTYFLVLRFILWSKFAYTNPKIQFLLLSEYMSNT